MGGEEEGGIGSLQPQRREEGRKTNMTMARRTICNDADANEVMTTSELAASLRVLLLRSQSSVSVVGLLFLLFAVLPSSSEAWAALRLPLSSPTNSLLLPAIAVAATTAIKNVAVPPPKVLMPETIPPGS
jgi:hypothetical protein